MSHPFRSAIAAAMLIFPMVPAVAHAAAASPTCIVSLSPSATESLYAIGAGSQVKAVDNDSNFPVGKLPTTRIDALNPSVESVIGVCPKVKGAVHKPDLVVISYDANSIKENLSALGVHVVEQDAANSLSDAQAQIRQLGSLTGHVTAANAAAKALGVTVSNAISGVAAEAKRKKVAASSVSVYYELDPTLYSLTSDTFVGSLMKSMGVTNIADSVATQYDYGYPQLSREYIVSASPKLIFLADTKCCSVTAAQVGARTGFANVLAVKYHHVVGLSDDVASRWGPRLGLLATQVATAIKAAIDQKSWTK